MSEEPINDGGADGTRRVGVIGLGVIGGSVAAGLKSRGWHVTGWDADSATAAGALDRGFVDQVGHPDAVEVVIVATPVSVIKDEVNRLIEQGAIVTDVGSTKADIVSSISAPNFVGGHPMAGSEKSGLAGVAVNMFRGATWVLTPGPNTSDEAYITVREIAEQLGAEVVTLGAVEHDEIVAAVSHVPHLTAALLMTMADKKSSAHEVLLRLAANGFRDMTRIAAGDSKLWVDIVLSNRGPIVEALETLQASAGTLAEQIRSQDRTAVEGFLSVASQARRELPLRQGRPAELAIVAVVIPDRPGALVEVLSIMSEAKVNVEDFDINHAITGGTGTLQLTVAADTVERAQAGLVAAQFVSSVEYL